MPGRPPRTRAAASASAKKKKQAPAAAAPKSVSSRPVRRSSRKASSDSSSAAVAPPAVVPEEDAAAKVEEAPCSHEAAPDVPPPPPETPKGISPIATKTRSAARRKLKSNVRSAAREKLDLTAKKAEEKWGKKLDLTAKKAEEKRAADPLYAATSPKVEFQESEEHAKAESEGKSENLKSVQNSARKSRTARQSTRKSEKKSEKKPPRSSEENVAEKDEPEEEEALEAKKLFMDTDAPAAESKYDGSSLNDPFDSSPTNLEATAIAEAKAKCCTPRKAKAEGKAPAKKDSDEEKGGDETAAPIAAPKNAKKSARKKRRMLLADSSQDETREEEQPATEGKRTTTEKETMKELPATPAPQVAKSVKKRAKKSAKKKQKEDAEKNASEETIAEVASEGKQAATDCDKPAVEEAPAAAAPLKSAKKSARRKSSADSSQEQRSAAEGDQAKEETAKETPATPAPQAGKSAKKKMKKSGKKKQKEEEEKETTEVAAVPFTPEQTASLPKSKAATTTKKKPQRRARSRGNSLDGAEEIRVANDEKTTDEDVTPVSDKAKEVILSQEDPVAPSTPASKAACTKVKAATTTKKKRRQARSRGNSLDDTDSSGAAGARDNTKMEEPPVGNASTAYEEIDKVPSTPAPKSTQVKAKAATTTKKTLRQRARSRGNILDGLDATNTRPAAESETPKVVSPKINPKKRHRQREWDISAAPSKVNPKKRHRQRAWDIGAAPSKAAPLPASTPKSTKKARKQQGQATATPAKAAPADVTPAAIKPQPQIDVAVHRLRHLPYTPRPILRLASAPQLSPSDPCHLAVSREGGTVELLAGGEDKWRTVALVGGMRERSVDCLTWTCGSAGSSEGSNLNTMDVDPPEGNSNAREASYAKPAHAKSERIQSARRLFGSSRDGTVFELDFTTGRQSHVLHAGGGGVFALASLPDLGYIAVGCEDGAIRIYSASKRYDGSDGPLELVSTLPGAGKAIISLAWTRPDVKSTSKELAGTVLYAGVADGTIRRYDCLSSSSTGPVSGVSVKSTGIALTGVGGEAFKWKSVLRMTVESAGRGVPTKVWSLRAHPDGRTLISGDSLGHVQFWDGLFGTLTCTFEQNDIGADVLDVIVAGEAGSKVFASGVDSRVVCIERVDAPADPFGKPSQGVGGGAGSRWVLTRASRPHTHDVRSLALCRVPDNSSSSSGNGSADHLLSGGLDTKLCSYSVAHFRTQRPKIAFPWPSLSPVSLAGEGRVLALRSETEIELHQLGPKVGGNIGNKASRVMDEDATHCGTVKIASKYNLTCSDISSDGRYLAASDAMGTMLFRLTYLDDGEGRKVAVPSRIHLGMKASGGCAALRFIPAKASGGQGYLLACASCDGPVRILRISTSNDNEDAADLADEDATMSAEEARNAGEKANVSIEHTFREHLPDKIPSAFSGLKRPVMELVASPCGRYLVAGRYTTGSGSMNLFSLLSGGGETADADKDGDVPAAPKPLASPEYEHMWSLPPTESPHTAVSFLGGSGSGGGVSAQSEGKASAKSKKEKYSPCLSLACADGSFYLFDPHRKRLTDWSRDVGLPSSDGLPRELTGRTGGGGTVMNQIGSSSAGEYPTGLAFNPSTPNKFLLVSHGFFCAIDLDRPIPSRSAYYPPRHVRARWNKKPKISPPSAYPSSADGDDGGDNFTMCLRYAGVLFLDFMGEDEMVVVERPWMNVVKEFPGALERRVYGMN